MERAEQACIGCRSTRSEQLDTISTDALITAYRAQSLGVDVSHLLPPDESEISLWQCLDCDLRWYRPLVSGDEDFYKRLQQHDWYYQEDKPEYLHAGALVSAGARVLEVGCGAGGFSRHLPYGVHYRGLEFNAEAIRRARERGLDVEARMVQAEAEIAPASYDVVCSFQVLEHVSDPESFLQACSVALKPGGRLIVATPSEDSFLSVVSGGWLNMPPHHLSRWTDAALSNAFQRVGVRVESRWHEPVAAFHAEWYASVMASLGLHRLIGRRPGLGNQRLAQGLLRRLRRAPSIDRWLQARGEAGFEFVGRGHTVCLSGTKPHSAS